MSLKFGRFAIPLLLVICAHTAAAAVSIRYTLQPLGGQSYRYVYTITNDGSLGGAAPVLLFDIMFDTSLYAEGSLQIVTPSNLHPHWSEQILSSLPGLPAAYDVLAISGGIPAGSTVTGFSVQFVWLGPGVPASQPFEIYNLGFSLLQSGSTAPNLAPIPAASTISLTALGVSLALAAAYQARRRIGENVA
jgi:hypothetical protein